MCVSLFQNVEFYFCIVWLTHCLVDQIILICFIYLRVSFFFVGLSYSSFLLYVFHCFCKFVCYFL
jgi:hypothetical protein